MKFSCKISSSILDFLENLGEDLTVLCEQSPAPLEILRDPSAWLVAHDMEAFLTALQRGMKARGTYLDYQRIGHSSAELKAWGILDHVLRMMPKPYEIFYHPESFIAYFVAPKPPIENFRKKDDGVEFDWPLLRDQFPLISEYLKAAFEAIPTYVGQPLSQCHWEDIHVSIVWNEAQNPLFSQQEAGHQVSPELFNSVVHELQKQQQALEERNQKLQKQNEELHRRLFQGQQMDRKESSNGSLELFADEDLLTVQPDVTSKEMSMEPFVEKRYRHLAQNLAKLNDYMYRAQQVITVMSGQNNTVARQVAKQLLRKVDWEHIRKQFPFLLQESFLILKSFDQADVPAELGPALTPEQLGQNVQQMDLSEKKIEAPQLVRKLEPKKLDPKFNHEMKELQ